MVNASNGLPESVVTVKSMDCFKIEFDRYLEVVRMGEYQYVSIIAQILWAEWHPPALKYIVLLPKYLLKHYYYICTGSS